MKQKLERNIKIDYIFRFVSNFDFASAVWVLYLGYKGMSLLEIGILEGTFRVVSFLSEVPSGAAADLWGRKRVLLYGRICGLLSSTMMLFASEFWQFTIAFVFMAWGYNFISGSEEALVYDSLKQLGEEDRFYKVNSRLDVIIEIAQGLGTFLGGILAQKSYVYCYVTTIFICAVSIIPCIFLKEPKLQRENKEKLTMKKHFSRCILTIKQNPKVIEILLFYSMVFTFYTSIYFYGQQYFYELNLNKVKISIIMLFTGLLSCLGALISEKAAVRYGEKTKYIATILISLCILGMVPKKIWIAILCFGIMGFVNTLLYPMQSASLNALIPSEQRATIISVSSMTFSMFMLILFPSIGAFADKFGLARAFTGVGMLIIIEVLLLLLKKAIKTVG